MPNILTKTIRYFTKGLFSNEIEKSKKFDVIYEKVGDNALAQLDELVFVRTELGMPPTIKEATHSQLSQTAKKIYRDRLELIAEVNGLKSDLTLEKQERLDEMQEVEIKHQSEIESAKELLRTADNDNKQLQSYCNTLSDNLLQKANDIKIKEGELIEKGKEIEQLKADVQNGSAREQMVVYQLLHHYSKLKIPSTEAMLKHYADIKPNWLKIENNEAHETSTGNN